MKTLIQIILQIVFLMNVGLIIGQHQSVQTGNWGDNSTWDGNNPGYVFGNNVNITINANDSVFTPDGQGLVFNNNATITVHGTLIINEAINANNNLTIDVKEGGIFIVYGVIDLHNNGSLEIDGDLAAEGIAGKNNNTVTGVGNVYCDDISGVNADGFLGVIAEDIPEYSITAPYELEVLEIGYLTVYLEWKFDGEKQEAVAINGGEYEFVGYRIVRNLQGSNHLETIIVGDIDEFGNFDNTVTSESYLDIIQQEDLPEGEVEPEYYIRAVYMNIASKSTDDYKISPKSASASTIGPLPIELYDFSAEVNNSSVIVNWTTATEINNDFFTIERSLDGRNWSVLGYVDGAGNSNSMLNYEFIDNMPVNGVSYYRLKQTDYDGKFEYFDPVALQFGSNSSKDIEILNIRSNFDNLNITVNSSGFEAVLDIVDLQGRVVYQNKVNTSQQMQDIAVRLPRSFSGEILFIRLYSNDGSDVRKVFVN